MSSAANAVPNGKKRVKKKKLNADGTSKGYTEKLSVGPIDYTFLLIVMILLVMGIIMMFSAGYAWAIAEGGTGTDYVQNQIIMAVVGLVGMFFASFFDYHWLRKPVIAYGFFVFCVILLLLCLGGPFADPHNNSYRWVKFPGIPAFQPSELMKLAIILLFAYIISVNYSKMKYFRFGIIPFMAVLGVVAVLMMQQPHLSGTIIIFAIGLIMMFVGGSKFTHLLGVAIVGVTGLALVVFYLAETRGFSYFEKRFVSWLDPFNKEAMDDTWQTRNSLIAIGSGGLFGLGLGNSRQKFLYLPEAKNDFVFAVVCEELGFVGAIMVIILFLLLIFRGMYIASKAPDKYGMMIALGLTVQIGLQALLNIAVVTNTIPNTGVSLPFFSYGGTALIMQLVEMGIVLNISRQSIIET
ncbi:MAG: cell division protein FtsW [Oscillospiraceae bacterium]|nr:cell division protein FtsW [Oscillospiraceae bacterium]